MITTVFLLSIAQFASSSTAIGQELLGSSKASAPNERPVYVNTEYFGIPSYHTNILIGRSNPPQHIAASFDLQWSNTWVASKACDTTICQFFHSKYDSQRSESYVYDGAPAELFSYPHIGITGQLGYEDFQLGHNLEVKKHKFVEAMKWSPQDNPSAFSPWGFDSAIGQSPGQRGFYNTSQIEPLLPSILDELMNGMPEELDEKCFSILLPREENQSGALSFGHVDIDMYKGDLVSHPVHPPDAKRWQIAGPRIKLRATNGSTLATYDLTDHIAYLDTTALASIFLPYQIQSNIMGILGGKPDGEVDCDFIGTYPHMVLIFGEQEISLDESYIRQAEGLFGVPSCRAAVTAIPHAGGNIFEGTYDWPDTNVLVLGTPFLQAVYSVYNWEDWTVSCKWPLWYPRKGFDVN